MNLAVIDIGTNSIHLLLVDVNEGTGKFRVLGRDKESVRLGSGSRDMKRLSERVMRDGVLAISRFKQLADAAQATIRAVATSAVREAENQAEFLLRVRRETGVAVEVASGFEEGRLTYLGVAESLPIFDRTTLLVDIGGGSTEFVVARRGEVLYDNSLRMGAVRFTERFFPGGVIAKGAIKKCQDYVAGMLLTIRRELREHPYDLVVGSSGTIQAIGRILNAHGETAESTKTNGVDISRKAIKQIVHAMCSEETVETRRNFLGLDPARADVIVAGALILDGVFDLLKLKQLTISDYALREGIVIDTLRRKQRKPGAHQTDIRYRSVLHLAEHFHFERKHALHVAGLALQIFDQTHSLHELHGEARHYLEAAAILHEIGSYVSHARHHQHSYYLIRNAELLGFNESEIEIIANVARYHRKSHPKPTHEGFARLGPDEQRIVVMLAAILRIADGLDRTHQGSIERVECRLRGGTVRFELQHKPHTSVHFEEWGASMKGQLFHEVFGRKVSFVTANTAAVKRR